MMEITQLTLDSVFNGVVDGEFVYAVATKVMTSQTCVISLVSSALCRVLCATGSKRSSVT